MLLNCTTNVQLNESIKQDIFSNNLQQLECKPNIIIILLFVESEAQKKPRYKVNKREVLKKILVKLEDHH